uniref:Uncharacterized protein n=1 Tax=viral metagenome TaxID=1070528 RepID=A0A6C0I5Z4_9ZZZZ
MNDSDKYIIDTFFDTIKHTRNTDPYLFKILSRNLVYEFYLELYDKLKTNYVSNTDLKNELRRIVVDIYTLINKRPDIISDIKNGNIKLFDFTDNLKKINIMKLPSQKEAERSTLFTIKSKLDTLKEKILVESDKFHPTQIPRRTVGKVIDEDKLNKVQNNLSILFKDKKDSEEIKLMAKNLVEQQPDKVKDVNIKLVEDLVQDISQKEKEIREKLKCKDDKILNKFTKKCVDKNSPMGIFMNSRNAIINEVTKENIEELAKLKINDLMKFCKKNAPNIGCVDMLTKKDLLEHVLNNINIHDKKLLCKDGKVYYKDVKECIDRRKIGQTKEKEKEKTKEKTKEKEKKEKTKEKTKKDVEMIYDNVPDDIFKDDDKMYKYYYNKLIKEAYDDGLIYKNNYKNTETNLIKLLRIIRDTAVKRINKMLSDIDIYNNAVKNKDYLYEIITDVLVLYFKKQVYADENLLTHFQENIFKDINENDLKDIYIMMKLTVQDILTRKDYSDLTKYKPQQPLQVVSLEPNRTKSNLSPDIKLVENITNKDSVVLEMIHEGIKDKLLGKKIKKMTTIRYLLKLLDNMNITFYKMLDQEREIITDENKRTLVNKYLKNNIDDKMDLIANNLIIVGLSTMTKENARIWLNTYLPIAFYKIV